MSPRGSFGFDSMANVKAALFLVKFLEDVGYDGPRHFDAHAYRTENSDGVKDFARGCMRTYLILRDRARRWNQDREIQDLLAGSLPDGTAPYSPAHRDALLGRVFDRNALARTPLSYERLDQLTMEVLLGLR